ncbi:MAG: Uma2 family endonuclease [Candidatus Eremiobacteraeota bacterium]|nr:Uma2 family endonuclease [Candidatus Eremiobacteraeota bacterium]
MSDMALEPQVRPFTVDEYHRMAAAGILKPDERIELIDGLLLKMPPIGPVHWGRHGRIVDYLSNALHGRARVFGQSSIPLEERSEPQPDIAILAYREDYLTAPKDEEIFAFVELAETSLQRDRGRKLRLYARACVPDYFLVDLKRNTLSHFTKPHELGYREERSLSYGDFFRLTATPDVELQADAFLELRP